MKKHLILLGLTLILALAILAGCTESVPSPGDGTTADETVTRDPASSGSETVSEETSPEETTENYFEINRIETVEPDTAKVIDMAVTDKGYDIYRLPEDQSWGYRYGVTYLYNDDGSVDAYFACVGTISGEWDWISYRHSPDGGKTWSEEKIVLTPTQGSMDHFSNCDPGVVYFNGYYYLGYTSTLNETGACNNVFVARSQNPDGPFEKWNGSGWGGYEPQPIFYYDENYVKFGMGEPSFVELNGTLYIYYTNAAPSGEYTMVATADATDENWPATIQHHGAAVKKTTDSIDVKYVEEWGKFIGIATGSRMGPESWLAVYESNDGMHFELVDSVREGTFSHLHNAGISSRRNGHIRLAEDAEQLRVVYAYGEGWGTWNTRVQPITLKLSDGNDMAAERRKPCITEFVRGEAVPADQRKLAMIRANRDVYAYPMGRGAFTLGIALYDTYFQQVALKRGAEGVTFKVYDESVCTIDPATWRVEFKGVGETAVELRYGELVSLFFVRVTAEREDGSPRIPVELTPVRDTYTIYVGERSIYQPQLRAQMKWADGSFTEYYVTKPDVVMTFTGYDESIISVSDTGVVIAKKAGETEVTMTLKDKSCTVKVIVTDDETKGFYRLGEVYEANYEALDFTVKDALSIVAAANQTQFSYDAQEQALKAVVLGGDPILEFNYDQSLTPLNAQDYKAIEIVCKSPVETSRKASHLQLFYCVGDRVAADAAYQTLAAVTHDGEYHTITIDLTKLKGWEGVIHRLRLDYYDQSEVGDTMYIKSITLIQK